MAFAGKSKKFFRRAVERMKSVRAKSRAGAGRKIVKRTVPLIFRKYPKFASFSLALGLSMIGVKGHAQTATRHMGGVEPALSPALRAKVAESQLTLFHAYPSILAKEENSFSNIRISQRTFDWGPVAIVENGISKQGESLRDSVKIGLAQRFKIGSDTLVDVGLLSPKLNERPEFKGMSAGVLFAHKSVVGEFHHVNEANRFSLGYKLNSGFTPYLSLADEGYYSKGNSIRLGAGDVHKLFGINLGKVSTDLGLRMSEREKPVVDVEFFFPTKFGGIALDAGRLGGPKEGVMAGAWVVFNLGKTRK